MSVEMKKNLTNLIDSFFKLDEDSQKAAACITQGMAIQTELTAEREKKEGKEKENVKTA